MFDRNLVKINDIDNQTFCKYYLSIYILIFPVINIYLIINNIILLFQKELHNKSNISIMLGYDIVYCCMLHVSLCTIYI